MSEKYALIWRKSVYDNEFRCTKCGAKLMKLGGRLGRAQILPDGQTVICADCGYHVAHIEPYDGPLEPGETGGEWISEEGGVIDG